MIKAFSKQKISFHQMYINKSLPGDILQQNKAARCSHLLLTFIKNEIKWNMLIKYFLSTYWSKINKANG